MKTSLIRSLPDLAQHVILEFLDYKLRCGRYMRQLPNNLPIYRSIIDRPDVEEVCYGWEDFYYGNEYIFKYEREDGTFYYGDNDGNESYFMISLPMKSFKERKYWLENIIEISYSYSDRNIYRIQTNEYEYDYDGSRQRL